MSHGGYFDYNATTQMSERSAAAVRRAIDIYANPSASYGAAQQSRALIADARAAVARLIGAEPEQVFFTSGGTESNNWILNTVLRSRTPPQAMLTTAIEHDAVLATARALCAELPCDLHIVRPQAHGAVVAADVRAAIRPGTRLVAVMLANNETGVIQPVTSVARIAREYGAFFHVDAVQAVGKMPVDVAVLGCDALSLSGHKLHGPKGIGALYLRDPSQVRPWMLGGGQERGKRSGTENLLGIAGLGAAAEEAHERHEEIAHHTRELKKVLLRELRLCGLAFEINGGDEDAGVETLPNTLNLSLRGVRAEALAAYLTMRHAISVSIGSACSNNKTARHSHVLEAMGLSPSRMQSALRISFGRYTAVQDIHRLVSALDQGVAHLGAIAEVA